MADFLADWKKNLEEAKSKFETKKDGTKTEDPKNEEKMEYTDDEIIRGGSDVEGGKGSIIKGRAKTKDGKKLWSSKNGKHYVSKELMEEADKEFDRTRSTEKLHKQASQMAKEKYGSSYTDEQYMEIFNELKSKSDIKDPPKKVEPKKVDPKKVEEKKVEPKKDGTKTEDPKKVEEKKVEPMKDESPELSETKNDDESSSSSNESTDTLGDLANDKNAFAKYLNTQYPSTIGAIVSSNSGLSISERIAMATKLVGKITGNAILANGMSLLGDNSYFSKIGEGVDLNSMTSDQQKKLADSIAEQTAEMAKDVVANRKVVDSFFPLKQDYEDEQTYKNKKEFLSGYGHVLSTMNDDELEDVLKSKGFNKTQISSVTKAKPFFKNSSKTSRENTKDITETKSKELEFKFQKFKNEDEKRRALREIDSRIKELENEKLSLGETYNVNKAIEAYGKFAQTMGAIGSSTFSSSNTRNSNTQSASQWNASLNAKVPVVGVSVGGGSSWGNSENVGSSDGSSTSYNEHYAYGGKKGEAAYKKWWNDNGKKVYNLLIDTIDEQIENLRADQNKLATMDIGVDDAVIGNGEIDSIQLKDGTTLDVNDADGAVITTNPVNKTCLSFAEGEVNPFEWLGYEGKKLTQAEAETIFDSKPLDGYDNIMNWLNS